MMTFGKLLLFKYVLYTFMGKRLITGYFRTFLRKQKEVTIYLYVEKEVKKVGLRVAT